MFKICKKLSAIILVLSFGVNSVYANEFIPHDEFKDPVKQFNYCYSAAHNTGASWAAYKVGEYYENGYGVKPDMIKAYTWYQIAATGKSEHGIAALASLKSKMTNTQITQGNEEYKKLANEQALHAIDQVRHFNDLS